jgi:hypothetical protein
MCIKKKVKCDAGTGTTWPCSPCKQNGLDCINNGIWVVNISPLGLDIKDNNGTWVPNFPPSASDITDNNGTWVPNFPPSASDITDNSILVLDISPLATLDIKDSNGIWEPNFSPSALDIKVNNGTFSPSALDIKDNNGTWEPNFSASDIKDNSTWVEDQMTDHASSGGIDANGKAKTKRACSACQKAHKKCGKPSLSCR